MITSLGKELRKLRLDLGITLFEMAQQLDISSGLLSSVETGKKPASPSLMERLAASYEEVRSNKAHFMALAEQTQKEVRIRLSEDNPAANELAVAFARKFNSLSDDQVEQLKMLFSDKKGNS